MNEKLQGLFEDTPTAIFSDFKMQRPNASISIFEGEFFLKKGDIDISINGSVSFNWLPSPAVRFKGKHSRASLDILDLLRQDGLELTIGNSGLGKCFISHTSMESNSSECVIAGEIHSAAILGDKSIPVSSVRFTIPNLRHLMGLQVKRLQNEVIKSSNSRIELNNSDYRITIDKSFEFQELQELLEANGGYVTLYSGELIRKKGSIRFDEVQDLIHCLSIFLSFLNGRRCSPYFHQGLHEGNVIWTDFTAYNVDQYKSVATWPSKFSIEGFAELWANFSDLWKDDSNRDFLVSAAHWYVEANSNSGYLEGSIVMVQIALELIYNWKVLERDQLILGKDGENISAANKIRLLLAQVNCSSRTPDSLKNLQEFIKSNNEIEDAVDAFVQIRNAIVHSQEEKRKRITKLDHKVKYEAQKLGLWYLEFSLLSILNFKGKYSNRCSTMFNEGADEAFGSD
jgi:hypothetical protein